MHRVAGFVLIFMLAITINDSALAEISVEPTRIVLTRNSQTTLVTVQNTGLRSQRITPTWVNMVQANDSVLHPSGNEIALADMQDVRVWPSALIVKPMSSQAFTLLTPPETDFTGETRIHLRLNIDPAHGTGARWAVVLPVLVKNDLIRPEVRITHLDLQENGDLSITMKNTAIVSSYGHIVVFDRDGLRLATLNNVNLYTPETEVTFSIKLPKIPKNQLTVRYLGDAEFAGIAFAEQVLQISPELFR